MDNVSYYFKLLFYPAALNAAQPAITMNSLLTLAGCIWALQRGDARAKYCALFLLVSFLTLILIFTAKADRYIYPLLPVFYLLGAYALLTGLRAIWRLAWTSMGSLALAQSKENTPRFLQRAFLQPLRLMTLFTMTLVCAGVLLAPTMPINGYNLFLSRMVGLPYHRHYPDYDAAARYVQQHWQKGDIVIAVSPAISIRYYVGQVDYFFSVDRALYLFEKDDHITDTPTGSVPLLSQEDFQSVLATHARIWVLTDSGTYQSALLKNKRFVFPPDLHIVYRGYGSTIYLRG